MRDTLLILHILSAFIFVGGAITTAILNVYAGRSTSARQIAFAADVQRKAGLFAVVPGAILALVFGSWLVVETNVDFSDGWISASYALWVVALALGPAVLGGHQRRVKQYADRLLADGVEDSAELRTQFNAPMARAVSALLGLIVVAFLFLMVSKPGA